MKKVLVVAPHPDDEIIGCGASILRHLKDIEEKEVHITYATLGDAPNPDFEQENYREMRLNEIQHFIKLLGIPAQNHHLLFEPVHRIDPDDLFRKLVDVVRNVQPQICYIPHAGETDGDHSLVSRVALDAIMRAPSKWFRMVGDSRQYLEPVEAILAYEISTPLGEAHYFERFTEEEIEKKLKLLQVYKSQRWVDYRHRTKGLNAFRGGRFGVYAEAFQVLRLNIKLF